MVVSTALLIRERGARATSIDDVLEHSGAPRGSVYHHFPGGRNQLLREAADFAGEFVAERMEQAGSTFDLLDSLVEYYRDQLMRTDFRAGCPIVAVAVEAGDPEAGLQEHAARAFARWHALLVERLAADGVSVERGEEFATLAISAVEGALVITRARRNSEPLDSVHRQLRELLRAELTDGRAR